ncbi:MAG: metallophosphoesterase [Chitinophagaceae bacterium]
MNKKITWNFLLAVLIAQSCTVRKFTIPVLPDTQEAVTRQHDMFYSQMRWLARSRDSLRIPMVLAVGDIVNFDNQAQWDLASKGYGILDSAKLQYALTLGNHDTEAVGVNSGSAAPGNVNENLRKTFKFNNSFPVSRLSWQGGRAEEGKSDNAFYTFKAGGKKWLVIALEFCARESVAQWMDRVMKAHPKHKVIVLTHYHLTPRGQVAPNNSGYGNMKVIDIFDKYIRPNKNAFMVLSGHVCYTAQRTDPGTQGNTIYQVLSDYQCQDNGGGYIRLLEVDVKKGTIAAKMYSPYYNKTLQDSSNFVISNIKF